MLSRANAVGRTIAQPLVAAPVVVVFDEGADRFLQLARHIAGHLVSLAFYSAVVSFDSTIGLGVKGGVGDMSYLHQPQVLA